MENSALVAHIAAENQWEKRAAWHQIVDRQATELIPAVEQITLDTSHSTATRITALWTLEGLGSYNPGILKKLMESGNDYLKREAIRTLGTFKPNAASVAALLTPYIEDSNAMVRSQVLRTLEEVNVANVDTIALLVKACKESLPGNTLGGSYERNFERFLARKALESYPAELLAYFDSPASQSAPPQNLLWALQALPLQQREKLFIAMWQRAEDTAIDDDTFITIAQMLDNPRVLQTVLPRFKKEADQMLELAVKNQNRINSSSIAEIYANKIEAMLQSDNPAEFSRALFLIKKLHSPHHFKTLQTFISSGKHEALHSQFISLLGNSVKKALPTYNQLFKSTETSFPIKLRVANTLLIHDFDNQSKGIEKWLLSLPASQQEKVVNTLCLSRPGALLVNRLLGKQSINENLISYKSALIMQKLLGKKRILPIYTTALKKEQSRKQTLKKQTETTISKISKLKGNPSVGQAIFNSCLACHAVGSRGQHIAPALDGSKDRDLAHLVTAIINPNEAVEAVYGLHYAVSNDGSYIEGYLKHSDDNGITIAVMGGAKVFIPQHLLLHEGSIEGRSFMPSSFANLPAQTLADLAAYIKTIE